SLAGPGPTRSAIRAGPVPPARKLAGAPPPSAPARASRAPATRPTVDTSSRPAAPYLPWPVELPVLARSASADTGTAGWDLPLQSERIGAKGSRAWGTAGPAHKEPGKAALR